jgi:TrmH family RNA methyltransferase
MITSVSNDKIKELMSLRQRKYREELNQFVVEGQHLVDEAIKLGIVKGIYTNLESYANLPYSFLVSEEVMKKITEVIEPQGVIAICQKPALKPLSDRILMLDHLQDPGNFGTLLRSALAFGFETILYQDSVDPFNSKVLRSTQGAIFRLNLIETNLLLFIEDHPEYTIYGTALKNAVSLTTIPRSDSKIAIILGNEGSGVNELILQKTVANIFIDIEAVESLNVAVAGSIIMHHLRRLEP